MNEASMESPQDSHSLNRALRRLVGTHPSARAVLSVIGGTNEGSTTVVDDIESALEKDGIQVDRGEIIDVFKELEKIGIGSFVVGRRGHPSRFEWGCSIDVSDLKDGIPMAIGESDGAFKPGVIEHRYRLRPEYEVVLSLPSDLSPLEADRLAGFVKTLPFGDG